jgi:ParB family transcriptional regulator, chromosome partitioning protein
MIEPLRDAKVREIPPDQIHRNPDNPRLMFRTEELETLLLSIKRYGIQVPLTVYQEGRKFVLIDGERRWRCALKLNLRKIPALVQRKPSDLENLLLMFNIHALREQWDYLTIANKLPKVIKLFTKEHEREPNEVELSESTGLTRGQIRRCRLLLDLPQKYRDQLLGELELPKHRQKISEDLFIEMERALKTVQNRVPSVVPNLDNARDALIKKYRDGVIQNVVDFRMLSKMATAIKNLGVDHRKASAALERVLSKGNRVSISDEFKQHFEMYYGERRLETQIDSLLSFLEDFSYELDSDPQGEVLADKLRKLREAIDKVLGE